MKIQEHGLAQTGSKGRKRVGKKLPQAVAPSEAQVLELGTEEGLGKFVIQSRSMRDLYRLATQVAGSDATILVYGESGTGKELFARLVHQLSGRRAKPFVPVNCGVLKGELFADKFFGHEAGAFTGAQRQRKGSFELAADGTLFLDEVGEIPPANQVDFLRVLEEKTFRRLGGERPLPFDARIVAATNRVLHKMVAAAEFRADLYYRLNVIPVTLPPLRERVDDIPPLAEYFLAMYRHRYHKPGVRLAPATLDALCDYPWPGNVRELEHVIERACVLCQGTTLGADQLPGEIVGYRLPAPEVAPVEREGASAAVLPAAADLPPSERILQALRRAGGNKAKAARLLGIDRTTLYRKIRELHLDLSQIDF